MEKDTRYKGNIRTSFSMGSDIPFVSSVLLHGF
jgi:hypothetical protein